MKAIFLMVAIALAGHELLGQESDTTTAKAPDRSEAKVQKVFYGGNVGLTFGSYFRLSVQPLVGYNVTPQFSAGVKAIYEYISDSRANTTLTWHNFGGSVFTRYKIVPQAYAHAEFAYISYDTPQERTGVPFLLLGGGYIQRISPNAGLFVEVLFDVLMDSKSPYEDWRPFISVGAAVGI